jgi:transposase, IS30 family
MRVGQIQSEIAQIMVRHKSTISRDMRRGCGRRGYRSYQAQNLSH